MSKRMNSNLYWALRGERKCTCGSGGKDWVCSMNVQGTYKRKKKKIRIDGDTSVNTPVCPNLNIPWDLSIVFCIYMWMWNLTARVFLQVLFILIYIYLFIFFLFSFSLFFVLFFTFHCEASAIYTHYYPHDLLANWSSILLLFFPLSFSSDSLSLYIHILLVFSHFLHLVFIFGFFFFFIFYSPHGPWKMLLSLIRMDARLSVKRNICSHTEVEHELRKNIYYVYTYIYIEYVRISDFFPHFSLCM